ncbi:hypothetical protein BX666DRAFT_1322319 [Dichotomocladium elegans]|nr:hypothetical protein BX666DRAFT_1322319 [Dichotomocladium elegans]
MVPFYVPDGDMLEQHYNQQLSLSVVSPQPQPQPSSVTATAPIDNNQQQQQQISILDQTADMTPTTPSGSTVNTMLDSRTSSSVCHPTGGVNNALHTALLQQQPHQQKYQQLATAAPDRLSPLPTNTLHNLNEQQQQQHQQQQSGLPQTRSDNASMVTASQDGLLLLDTTILQQQTPHVMTPSAAPGSVQTTPLPSPLEHHAGTVILNPHSFPQQQQEQDPHCDPLQRQHEQMIQDIINSGVHDMTQSTPETVAAITSQRQNEGYDSLSAATQTMISSQLLPMDSNLHINHHPGSLAPPHPYDTIQTANALMIHQSQQSQQQQQTISTDNHQVMQPAIARHELDNVPDPMLTTSLASQAVPQTIIPVQKQQYQCQHHPIPPSACSQGISPITTIKGEGLDDQQQHIGKHLLHNTSLTASSCSVAVNARKKIRRHTMSTPYPTQLNIQQQEVQRFDPTVPHSATTRSFNDLDNSQLALIRLL